MPADGSQDMRLRILDAALGLLAGQGFMEVTQPKIAKAAGVRQSHLTYYFPTRSELLKALAVHSIESMLGSLAAGASTGKLTPALFAQLSGEALADKRRARVMLGLIVSSEEDREIKQFMRDFVARVRVTLTGVARLLGREPDAKSIAALHMLFIGATVLNVARDDANSRRECAEIARLAVETFLPGTPPATEPKARRRKS
ncbi:MAG TPA: TetR/AcrR family transcriptional regulator [Burkholderiales bacterium]|nr:TetR/AcrR family transcriptional regulator [Burkholderiales bacterium]